MDKDNEVKLLLKESDRRLERWYERWRDGVRHSERREKFEHDPELGGRM